MISNITDHPLRILIIGGSGSGKADALSNLLNNQPGSDKIYLYAKDPYEAKYWYLINSLEDAGIRQRFKTTRLLKNKIKFLISFHMEEWVK